MESLSFLNNEGVLDSEISVDEIEGALKSLKLGKSGGGDMLNAEHILYGGNVLKFG